MFLFQFVFVIKIACHVSACAKFGQRVLNYERVESFGGSWRGMGMEGTDGGGINVKM